MTARDRTRELGHRQRGVMKSLLSAPYPGGGWCWSTHGQTITLLESLVKRGLVEKVRAGMERNDPRRRPGLMEPLPHDRYQLTADGRLLAEEFAMRRATCVCGAELVKTRPGAFWWHSDTQDPKLLAAEPHEPRPAS